MHLLTISDIICLCGGLTVLLLSLFVTAELPFEVILEYGVKTLAEHGVSERFTYCRVYM